MTRKTVWPTKYSWIRLTIRAEFWSRSWLQLLLTIIDRSYLNLWTFFWYFLSSCPQLFATSKPRSSFSTQPKSEEANPLSICTGFFPFSILKYRAHFFPSLKYQVPKSQFRNPFHWVRVVKNVISKWTKIKFHKFRNPEIKTIWFDLSRKCFFKFFLIWYISNMSKSKNFLK